LNLLLSFGAGGLFDIQISFTLKNRLHLEVHRLAHFRLLCAIPLYLRGAAAGYYGRVLVMLSEQEKLHRDIHSLTKSIRLCWADAASKPMRPKDRKELRGHIAGLVTELGRFLGLLDQGSGQVVARSGTMRGPLSFCSRPRGLAFITLLGAPWFTRPRRTRTPPGPPQEPNSPALTTRRSTTSGSLVLTARASESFAANRRCSALAAFCANVRGMLCKRERHIAATLPLFGQGSQNNGKQLPLKLLAPPAGRNC
jgi:hypothetical protein